MTKLDKLNPDFMTLKYEYCDIGGYIYIIGSISIEFLASYLETLDDFILINGKKYCLIVPIEFHNKLFNSGFNFFRVNIKQFNRLEKLQILNF